MEIYLGEEQLPNIHATKNTLIQREKIVLKFIIERPGRPPSDCKECGTKFSNVMKPYREALDAMNQGDDDTYSSLIDKLQ